MQSLSKKDKEALSRQIGVFLQRYRRKAQKGKEPNDRNYDREIEQIIRKLKPEDLDALLNGEEDERSWRLDTSVALRSQTFGRRYHTGSSSGAGVGRDAGVAGSLVIVGPHLAFRAVSIVDGWHERSRSVQQDQM